MCCLPRIIIPFKLASVAAVLALLASVAVAQTDTVKGALPEMDTGPGLDTLAPDGVSTRTVRAVPCSTAARETDGTATCVGIPEGDAKAKKRR